MDKLWRNVAEAHEDMLVWAAAILFVIVNAISLGRLSRSIDNAIRYT